MFRWASRHMPLTGRAPLAMALCAGLGVGCAAPAAAAPYKPYQFGLWSFAPTVELNAIFNDNLFGSNFRKVTAGGFELAPNFTLTRDAGLHLTTISAGGTAAFYPGHTRADTHAERIALAHVFRPWREQSFTLNANYSQSFGGLQAPNAGLVSATPSGDIKVAQVGLATERAFGRLVTTASVNASMSDVKNSNFSPIIIGTSPSAANGATGNSAGASPALFAALPAGRSSTLSATAGASYVGPLLTPFASVSVTSQKQEFSDTGSLQVQTGVSIGRWRLYRGEVHVGYLVSSTDQRFFTGSTQSDTRSPSVGGSVTWDPLRYLSVTAAVNAQFGAVALPSISSVLAASGPTTPPTDGGGAPPAAPTTAPAGTVLPAGQGGSTLSFTGSAAYSFARRWTATAGFGYTILNSGGQKSKVATASMGASYLWSQTTDLTFSYAFTQTDSQLAQVLGVIPGLPGLSEPLATNVVRAGLRQRF